MNPSAKLFIGIPILNRMDLLNISIDAIDYPAEILVVNNSTNEKFKSQLSAFAKAKSLSLLHQERNLGVAGSWNLIIRTGIARGYDWIFIGSNDTFLAPGSLKAAVEVRKGDDYCIWHLHASNYFLLRKQTIELVGWFDENFYPAYKEDQDYAYRCNLAGLKRLGSIPKCNAEHVGSATIRSDPHYTECNGNTQEWNYHYYRRKWGGDAGNEIFKNPFNDGTVDHKWWPAPDIADQNSTRNWDKIQRLKE